MFIFRQITIFLLTRAAQYVSICVTWEQYSWNCTNPFQQHVPLNSRRQFFTILLNGINKSCVVVLGCVSNNLVVHVFSPMTAVDSQPFSVQLVLDPHLPQCRQISAPRYSTLGRPSDPAGVEQKCTSWLKKQMPKGWSILCRSLLTSWLGLGNNPSKFYVLGTTEQGFSAGLASGPTTTPEWKWHK